MMKTSKVKALVLEILDGIPAPYTEHVIEEVFQQIEGNEDWLGRYQVLCDRLGKAVVNNWCGQWVANAVGKRGELQVPSRRCTLIGSYSLLDTDAVKVVRKPTENEALQLMADYYQLNKASIPGDIRQYREMIVELIMDGMPAAEAFSSVQPEK